MRFHSYRLWRKLWESMLKFYAVVGVIPLTGSCSVLFTFTYNTYICHEFIVKEMLPKFRNILGIRCNHDKLSENVQTILQNCYEALKQDATLGRNRSNELKRHAEQTTGLEKVVNCKRRRVVEPYYFINKKILEEIYSSNGEENETSSNTEDKSQTTSEEEDRTTYENLTGQGPSRNEINADIDMEQPNVQTNRDDHNSSFCNATLPVIILSTYSIH